MSDVKPVRILYVCEDCHRSCAEMCGRSDPSEIFITPDGRWLCELCVGETKWPRSKLTHPRNLGLGAGRRALTDAETEASDV